MVSDRTKASPKGVPIEGEVLPPNAVLPPLKPARWNQTRQHIFLEHLATCANVAASERAAGMSAGSAYKLRARSDEFRAAWSVALREGYEHLELALLDRALNGVEVEKTRPDGTIERSREYSERLQMLLYTQHRAAAKGLPAGALPGIDIETAKQRLARKIAAIRERQAHGA